MVKSKKYFYSIESASTEVGICSRSLMRIVREHDIPVVEFNIYKKSKLFLNPTSIELIKSFIGRHKPNHPHENGHHIKDSYGS